METYNENKGEVDQKEQTEKVREQFFQNFKEQFSGVDTTLIDAAQKAINDGNFEKLRAVEKVLNNEINRLEENYKEHWSKLN